MKIKNIEKELLSDNWYHLYKYSFDYQKTDGQWERHRREVYDRGNGAAILLYNPARKTIILTRQFRIPTYVNGNENGMMTEVCAGLLDGHDPVACIIKETEEETGYRISEVKKVMEAYMSPGAVTEMLFLFIGIYEDHMKVGEGGGSDEETEDIEVLEVGFDKAVQMMESGEIRDAKSIMLLQYAQVHGLMTDRSVT